MKLVAICPYHKRKNRDDIKCQRGTTVTHLFEAGIYNKYKTLCCSGYTKCKCYKRLQSEF